VTHFNIGLGGPVRVPVITKMQMKDGTDGSGDAPEAQNAGHEEYDNSTEAGLILISRLECSLVCRELEINFSPESRAAAAYGSSVAIERLRME
jgi:hypothetical protein